MTECVRQVEHAEVIVTLDKMHYFSMPYLGTLGGGLALPESTLRES